MSAHPQTDLPDLSDEEARKRFHDELRAAGITPATERGPRLGRVAVRKPSRLLGYLRAILRIR